MRDGSHDQNQAVSQQPLSCDAAAEGPGIRCDRQGRCYIPRRRPAGRSCSPTRSGKTSSTARRRHRGTGTAAATRTVLTLRNMLDTKSVYPRVVGPACRLVPPIQSGGGDTAHFDDYADGVAAWRGALREAADHPAPFQDGTMTNLSPAGARSRISQ